MPSGARAPSRGKVRMNPLKALQDYGQSVWLDYFRRSLVTSGELQVLIAEDGLRGSHPTPRSSRRQLALGPQWTPSAGMVVRALVLRRESLTRGMSWRRLSSRAYFWTKSPYSSRASLGCDTTAPTTLSI